VGQWRWTGFEKTLWDGLQLLIVPVMIALVGAGFTAAQGYIQLQAEERRAQAQRAAEEQRAQDEALQAYFEGMESLLLEEDLRSSGEDDEVRTLADARTSTVLSRVDGPRKRSIVLFLHQARLIRDQPIVALQDADLSNTDLSRAGLEHANLSGADLSDAYLGDAVLGGANLSGANLSGAILSVAHLDGADLSFADLRGVDLSFAWLPSADLEAAVLEEADLEEAYLDHATLIEADLSRTTLIGATLNSAQLRNANLSDADLSRVRRLPRPVGLALREEKVTYLRDADLSGADLSNADLSEADLSGAQGVTDEQLADAWTLEGATMPDGSVHD